MSRPTFIADKAGENRTLCRCEKFVIEEEPGKWWEERPATDADKANLTVGDILCNKCEEVENGS